MPHNDLTFFTNEPDRDLYTRFSNILKNNTQFFDILVGYFRTSGFFKLYPAMSETEKIRVLVGLNVDYKTVEILNLSHKEAKEAFSQNIEDEFNSCDDSSEIEKGVSVFIDWLRTGKIEMRIHTEAPIHAKVYIMRKDPNKNAEQFGSVITGSSNFSMAGLMNNLEFNVELKDSRDVQFALDKFEELWAKSIDIKDAYIATIEEKTWLRDDISPYELYLKTLYEYFKEEINADKEAILEEILPDGFMRLQYQLDAVIEAEKKLEAYGGVFISDVVGLGKTYICALLAKKVKKGKKLFICPPVLVDYWKKVLLDFDVPARVESLGNWHGFRQDLDNYFCKLYLPELNAIKPIQEIPEEITEIIRILEGETDENRIDTAHFLLNLSSEAKKDFCRRIHHALRRQPEIGRMVEISAFGEIKYCLFISMPGIKVMSTKDRQDYVWATILGDESMPIMWIDLDYDKDRKLRNAKGKQCNYCDIPTGEIDRLKVLSVEITKSTIESFRRQYHRKVGRNDPCPCGSGKKYKKCCIQYE